MPSTRDWIHDPLAVVEGMFAASQSSQSSGWETKAVEFFKEQLKDREAQTLVPSLNDVPLHYLKPDSLVRFRCLVQDMFDPEFFMGVYETVDPTTKARTLRCGKYKDVTESGVDLNSRNTVTAERQTFYCVPIPGENQWAKDGYAASTRHQVVPSTSYVPSRQKRSYEEDEEMEVQPQKQKETHAASPSGADPHGTGDGKRQETAAPSGAAAPSASHLDLNFPLPGEKGPSCLLKVYEDWDGFRLNDALQVFGILSVSPALSALAEEKDPVPDPEQRVQNLPASLVPRLHLLYAERLDHSNPLLPGAALQDNGAFLSALGEMAAVRAELLSYFTHVLLGDALAAEFLLLHLLSSVYSRRDVLPLGKFSLNLSGCPAAGYTQRLYQVVQQLVPASFYLPMSLQNLTRMRLVPTKDYVSNRLLSGALQLAASTSLFLDETRLEPGRLDAAGVRNVTALGNLVTWQKVDYDFSFHQMEFPCNINVLITSEGRSLLPSDCHVHLQPQVAPAHLEDHLSSIQVHPQAQLNRFRVFLSVGRLLDYSISDEVTKAVEDDFVDMRKDDPHSVSADDLHRMLVVARLLSLSLGQTSLTRDIWVRAKHIETLRRSRMEQHKSVNGNEP